MCHERAIVTPMGLFILTFSQNVLCFISNSNCVLAMELWQINGKTCKSVKCICEVFVELYPSTKNQNPNLSSDSEDIYV